MIISFFPFFHWKVAPCPSSTGVEIFDSSPGRSQAWTEKKFPPLLSPSRPFLIYYLRFTHFHMLLRAYTRFYIIVHAFIYGTSLARDLTRHCIELQCIICKDGHVDLRSTIPVKIHGRSLSAWNIIIT